ncbi:hypothetical protein M9H77_13717 [Catharanthus roseus]|uniref:Uncharacterized protein n=1 Tax=Catharanthus roseus TaxID=4058 RepID=A0ACC0BL48_CATRO|nr:hypothetical protein M9H77_13717 [Catharanthus roseus]
MDEVVVHPAITIKAIRHQWYWIYEYSDYNSSDEYGFTSQTHLRIVVTLADIPYSLVVPFLGVKYLYFGTTRGVYYYQFSEICGTNHAFMPIVVEAFSRKDYGDQVYNQLRREA